MISQKIINAVRIKFKALKPELDERGRRMWAATEATSLGYGGVAAISKATAMAESTIRIGKREMAVMPIDKKADIARRVRKKGGGRKPLAEKDANLIIMLDALVEPFSRGDPISPLRWTCKSTRKLAQELSAQGHPVSHAKVGQLLTGLNYSLQSTRKRMEGKSHPDRDAQFKFINSKVVEYQKRCQPVISVDAKKKELIGRFSNAGREYQPVGKPEEVETYDFPSMADGKGIPYGIYDMTKNQGWVSVGTDHDTAQFAVHSINQWWRQMGKTTYPNARELLITADGGGSNGSRNRLWKIELQDLADKTNLNITVCHFPPGTSKWNKIEHRMFSHITKNWRGRPLTSYEVVVNLIANTTTSAGLKIKAALDEKEYPTGIKITDKELKSINLIRNNFHGEWNYTISPS
jgi:Rhodopirellula transposase DDE domain